MVSRVVQSVPISARYMALSAFGFACMAVFVKLSSLSGIPALEIVAARALVSLVLSYADVRCKGLVLWGHRKGLLFARGAVGALALFCVYYALTALPLAVATFIQYLHPMFTGVLAFVFLREAFQRSTLLCIALSLIGLLMIVQPSVFFGAHSASYNLLALWAAVLGALGSAVAYVLVRKLNQTEESAVIIFYFPLVALPLSILFLGRDFVIPEGISWLYLLCVGLFTQVGQVGLTLAMKTETAAKATAYSYLQVVFAVFFGWLIFSEYPTLWTFLGGGCILAGALVNLYWKR